MTQLAILEEATRMLAECRTVDEAKKIRDLAEAARVYAREAGLGKEAMNHAAEISLRAEKRAGEVIDEMVLQGLMGRGKSPSRGDFTTVADLGIDHNESAGWQKLAKADPSQFEQYITDAKDAGTPITTNGALRYLTPLEKRQEQDRTHELFVIYNALQAIAAFDKTPKQWARLNHGPSRFRVDENLEQAWQWIDELRRIWGTS